VLFPNVLAIQCEAYARWPEKLSKNLISPTLRVAEIVKGEPIRMSIPLSEKTKRAAAILLPESEQERIEERLVTEVAEETPIWHDFSPEGMERIRFAILKLVSQHPKNEEIAFKYAKYDWRDLFMSAGFADSATEHERWYDEIQKS